MLNSLKQKSSFMNSFVTKILKLENIDDTEVENTNNTVNHHIYGLLLFI